jgi:DNA/RNA endonuclease G (NUC1)
MHVPSWRLLLPLFLAAVLLSCSDGGLLGPAASGPQLSASVQRPDIVVSQIYGGGGNSGATWTHDFVELFNPGDAPVSVGGWVVGYASATGSTWNRATLPEGTVIQPGRYFLIQMAAGSGGTTPLPTPDLIGSANMAAGHGKVVLSRTDAAVSGVCPAGDAIVELVGFGSNSNCGPATPTLTNTTAALRQEGGCAYSANHSADFVAGTPTPRNSAAAPRSCGAPSEPTEPETVTVTPASATLVVGGTQSFTASAVDVNGTAVPASFTWSSDDAAVVTVDAATGVATAVAPGSTTVRATTGNGKVGTAAVTVTGPGSTTPADVVISGVYGGGGNSGATLSHDYVELFNRGTSAVEVGGWRVQYASASGTSWQVLELPGDARIAPGGYYLVQLATNNASIGAPLPAPDAVGTINMAGSNGKVALTVAGATLSGACPVHPGLVDRVNYGTANCGEEWGRIAALSSSTAAFRQDGGCMVTGDAGDDFYVTLPAARNSGSPVVSCPSGPAPAPSGNVVINEIMAMPHYAESDSWGEWFEVLNLGSQPVNLQGWSILSRGQQRHTIGSSVVIPAGGIVVLGRATDRSRNGDVEVHYNYFTGSASTIVLDDAVDWLILREPNGAMADSVRWNDARTFTRGASRALRNPGQPNADVDGANWGYSTTPFGDGDYGSPGQPNGSISDVAPAVPNRISFSGRVASDQPLPVGWEAQLFATLRDPDNVVIPTTFIWVSETPSIASVDHRGVIRSLAPGTARFRATAADGTSRVHSLAMEMPVAGTAVYLNQSEFGEPFDSDPSDDFVIRYPEFTSSWNRNRGTPNWVTYNINATNFGGGDRCNCFTFDESLPADFSRYNTADYTGAGAHAGYGIDRGHLVRSFDRTNGTLDNARTYLFTNIVPQTADNNQGPWSVMESYLGDLARFSNREVYVIAGVAGSLGTVKDEGRITIPANLWKVAVILPRGMGVADVTRHTDLEVVAVIMPNLPGIRNVDWRTYETTVEAIEAVSGYNLLRALPDPIRIAVSTRTQPPTAVAGGPYSGSEGSPITFSASGSSDPDPGQTLTFRWEFPGGTVRGGESVTHTFPQDGSFQVRLIATDPLGLADTATAVVNVANVPPVVNAFEGATLLPGETYRASGTFTDPGTDPWTGTVNYGDGSGVQTLALSGRAFALQHTYAAAGSFTVTVKIADNHASDSLSASVVVWTLERTVDELSGAVDALLDGGVSILGTSSGGRINQGTANSLRAKLNAARTQIGSNPATAASQIGAFVNEVEGLLRGGVLVEREARPLIDLGSRLRASLSR